MSDTNDKIRIVQETVAGKEITFAHVIGGPAPIIYQKLGLNPAIDYGAAAIGIMNMTPPESAVIAADIAVKSGDVYLGFADRFTGTVIITGELADVTSALTEIVNYFRDELGYVVSGSPSGKRRGDGEAYDTGGVSGGGILPAV